MKIDCELVVVQELGTWNIFIYICVCKYYNYNITILYCITNVVCLFNNIIGTTISQQKPVLLRSAYKPVQKKRKTK